MEKSCGIIVFKKFDDNKIRLLMCSPSGPYWKNRKLFCFPKGGIEPTDENDLHTAIREFYEETSIQLEKYYEGCFVDLGLVKQNKKKTVHVYAVEDKFDIVKPEKLHCINKITIEFPLNSNNFIEIEEVDSYQFMTKEEILNSSHIEVYDTIYMNLCSININKE